METARSYFRERTHAKKGGPIERAVHFHQKRTPTVENAGRRTTVGEIGELMEIYLKKRPPSAPTE